MTNAIPTPPSSSDVPIGVWFNDTAYGFTRTDVYRVGNEWFAYASDFTFTQVTNAQILFSQYVNIATTTFTAVICEPEETVHCRRVSDKNGGVGK